jgi:hypothetical protein
MEAKPNPDEPILYWVDIADSGRVPEWHGSFNSGKEAIEYCYKNNRTFNIWMTFNGRSPKEAFHLPWLIVSDDAEEFIVNNDIPVGDYDLQGNPLDLQSSAEDFRPGSI